ncbi:hypothetical protein BHE74_00053489, partial [Ensete ventricosum]
NDKGYGEGNEQRSSRGIDDGLERKKTVAVGLKGGKGGSTLVGEEWLVIAIKEESKAAMKKVGWKWLGSGKGCAAAATTKEEGKITRRSAAVVVVCRNKGGGGRLL